MILDQWQKDVLECDTNLVLRAGRQVGKSTVIAIKAGEYAINHANKTIMIIAAVERQASLLFEKTLGYLIDTHKNYISKGKDRPTKHIINLVNGSRIMCLPTGLSGNNIRGFTIDMLIADEAAFIPEQVYVSVIPALLTTKGKIILLSTPFGRNGYFYDCFQDDNFTKFHVSSEDCPRADKDFLARQKANMSKFQYAQEFLGEFVDELMQFFTTDLIRSCMTLDRANIPKEDGDNFCGVDIARMGGDETVIVSLKRINKEEMKMIDMNIDDNSRITETTKKIMYYDKMHKYKKIYLDDGGLGVGVFDELLYEAQTKRKVVALNNASRPLDKDEKRNKKILKEDLYLNLLRYMEQGKIKFFDEPEIMLSLKSVQYEYDNGNMKIFGNYTHIAEALIRAAWCMKDKSLNIWAAFKKN